MLFPGTGPGGYFEKGRSRQAAREVANGLDLMIQIARTQTRAWIETDLGGEFALNRKGLRASLQIEGKPKRRLPCASLKWNKETKGTTEPLRIEEATMKYLDSRFLGWGNNRNLRNNYVAGSTLSGGFKTPFMTVYFDHLMHGGLVPSANEAFAGLAPSRWDVDAWIYLANRGIVRPGMIVNFQNGVGRSMGRNVSSRLLRAGHQVSVVPFAWLSSYLDESSKDGPRLN